MRPKSPIESPHPTIDIEHDRLIPVQEICKQRLGYRISPATAWRWRLHGVGPNRSKLEMVRCSGRWFTTMPAFNRFLREQQPDLAAAATEENDSVDRSETKIRRLRSAGLIRDPRPEDHRDR